MKLSLFGHFCFSSVRHPSGASSQHQTLHFSISGSERLQVEMWIADYNFFFPPSNMWSIGVSVQRIESNAGGEERRGEERRGEERREEERRAICKTLEKKLTLSLPQPDKLPTERSRMDACYFFSSFRSFPSRFLPRSLSLSLLSLSPSHTHTHTHTHTHKYSVLLYLYTPTQPPPLTPISFPLPLLILLRVLGARWHHSRPGNSL